MTDIAKCSETCDPEWVTRKFIKYVVDRESGRLIRTCFTCGRVVED